MPPRAAFPHRHRVPADHVDGALRRRRTRIDEDLLRPAFERPGILPALAPVRRHAQRRGASLAEISGPAKRPVQRLRICRIDRQRRETPRRLPAREEDLSRVVVRHPDTGHRGGVRVEHVPRIAPVRAAPQRAGLDVDHVGIDGIEQVEARAPPQVEHPPRAAAVVRHVRARHVAVHQHVARIVGADGGGVHGSPAARAKHLPGIVARRGGPRHGQQQGRGEEGGRKQAGPNGSDTHGADYRTMRRGAGVPCPASTHASRHTRTRRPRASPRRNPSPRTGRCRRGRARPP